MSTAVLADPFRNLIRAVDLEEIHAQAEPWSRDAIAGRLVELSGEGRLTLACSLVVSAQTEGEPVAWVSASEAPFFPPDMAANGVDLEALPVVRVPDALWAARAADRHVRSGAFGLLVVDLGEGMVLSAGRQGRLAQLAHRHDTALLCLCTEERGGSSLVSLRVRGFRSRLEPTRFRCGVQALKDRRRGAGWRHQEECRGAGGLR